MKVDFYGNTAGLHCCTYRHFCLIFASGPHETRGSSYKFCSNQPLRMNLKIKIQKLRMMLATGNCNAVGMK